MKNQRGITLVELLASLAILTLVSTLIYGVFIGVQKNFNRSVVKTSLSQEANLIVATIKNYHTKNDKYYISLNPSTKAASIGLTSTTLTSLHKSNMKMEMKIENTKSNTYATLSSTVQIDSKKPLKLYFKLVDTNGDYEEIETIVKRY